MSLRIRHESLIEKESNPVLVKNVIKNSGTYLYHWHDYYEMLFVEKGTIKLLSENSSFCEMSRGDFAVISPGVLHDTICLSPADNSAELTVIQFYLSYLNINQENIGFSNTSSNSNNSNSYQNCDAPMFESFILNNQGDISDKVRDIVHSSLYEYKNRSTGYEYILKGNIYQLLGIAERCGIKSFKIYEKSRGNFDIRKIIKYIETNIDKKISLSEISRINGYSESYFSRKFKKYAGTNFKRYIDFIKIRKAKNIIMSENVSITEIAASLGYDNVQGFCRAYKRITGHTALCDRHYD